MGTGGLATAHTGGMQRVLYSSHRVTRNRARIRGMINNDDPGPHYVDLSSPREPKRYRSLKTKLSQARKRKSRVKAQRGRRTT